MVEAIRIDAVLQPLLQPHQLQCTEVSSGHLLEGLKTTSGASCGSKLLLYFNCTSK